MLCSGQSSPTACCGVCTGPAVRWQRCSSGGVDLASVGVYPGGVVPGCVMGRYGVGQGMGSIGPSLALYWPSLALY